MAPSSSTQARRAARQIFKELDVNNDGVLSIDEIERGMKFLGVAEGSEELFDIVDSDRSGSVSISEFIDGWQVWQDGIMSKGECLVDRRIKFGDYIQQELLRVGTNGAIHRVTSPIDNESYAAKIIGKSCFRTTQDQEAFRLGLDIHGSLSHGNIVKLLGVNETRDECQIIMELCKGGSLLSAMESQSFREKDVARLAMMLLEAVDYCHNNKIVHRDITVENLLLDSTDIKMASLKLNDFSSAARFQPGQKEAWDEPRSPAFASPEVLLGEPAGPEADIWSCGVTIYFLLTGKMPFDVSTLCDLYQDVLQEDLRFPVAEFCQVSSQAMLLLTSMLSKDPSQRPSISQCLASEWIAGAGAALEEVVATLVNDEAKKFASMNRLKRQAYKICAENMKASDVKDMKRLFQKIDTRREGRVNIRQLFMVLSTEERLCCSAAELEKAVLSMDVDGDGTIEYSEFISATTKTHILLTEQRLTKAFQSMDADGSGSISVEELKTCLQGDDKELAGILKACDKNGDGEIDYEEFMDMVKTQNDTILEEAKGVRRASKGETKMRGYSRAAVCKEQK